MGLWPRTPGGSSELRISLDPSPTHPPLGWGELFGVRNIWCLGFRFWEVCTLSLPNHQSPNIKHGVPFPMHRNLTLKPEELHSKINGHIFIAENSLDVFIISCPGSLDIWKLVCETMRSLDPPFSPLLSHGWGGQTTSPRNDKGLGNFCSGDSQRAGHQAKIIL